MRLFRCKHRRLSLPVNGKRSCLRCSAEFPYSALTLSEQDREQAAAIQHSYDHSNIANKKQSEVVRPMRKKESK